MTQPWGQRPTRRCHRISPHRLIIWRGAKPLLCKDAPHAGQGGQAVGRRARSARTASTRWTARTRAACHAARISAGSEGASSTARSRRCISRSSSRMLSCRHSIGHRPPLETLVRGSKSVPHFRCYASPPPTKTCARRGRDFAARHAEVIFAIQPFVEGAAAYYADVKERMGQGGRHPDDCKILFGVQPFVAETAPAARDKQTLHNSLVSLEGAVVHLSGSLGYDFSQTPLDTIVEPFAASRSQGIVDMYTRVAGKRLTLREMAQITGRASASRRSWARLSRWLTSLRRTIGRLGGMALCSRCPTRRGLLRNSWRWSFPCFRSVGSFVRSTEG